MAIDDVFGTFDLDPAASDCPDHDLVAGSQAGSLENTYWERDLVLSGDLAHRFTILPRRKGHILHQTSIYTDRRGGAARADRRSSLRACTRLRPRPKRQSTAVA
jgi:hypothetical protein